MKERGETACCRGLFLRLDVELSGQILNRVKGTVKPSCWDIF